jgi:Na+/citrate or Na+/malate symporter
MNHSNKMMVVAVIGGLLAAAFVGFIVGTVVGFNTAMQSLSSCQPHDCTSLGVNATSCEVCKESSGYKILKVG